MKVLLVSPSAAPGGAERALTGLARHLPAHGFEPHAVLLQPGPLEAWLSDAGCPVEVVDAGRTRQLHRTVGTIRMLATRARGAVAVISNQSRGHVYGGLAARLVGVPSIWWQHGIPSRNRLDSIAAMVPSATIVCGSSAAAAAQVALTPSRRVERIPPGIPVELIRSFKGSGRAIRDAFGWQGVRVVGQIGRLQSGKGQDLFLMAAARLVRSRPAAVFVVVGGAVLGSEGDYPDRLRSLALELGVSGSVLFAGHQEPVYPWFDACDVVVNASQSESFGLVLVEAMALDKPLVSTSSAGPIDIVEDGVSGLLVPAGDVEQLAGAIERVLGSPELEAQLARGARHRANQFSEQHMAQQFAVLLHRCHRG